MYPQELVKPMKQDLTEVGFKELLNAEEVTQELSNHEGTALLS